MPAAAQSATMTGPKPDPVRLPDRQATRLLLAAAVLLVVVFGWVAPYSRFDLTYDLRVYRAGAVDVVNGIDPYIAPPRPYLGPLFTYPPFAAVAFAPLALVPIGVDRALVTSASLGLLVLLVVMSVMLARPSIPWDRRFWTVVLAAVSVGMLLEPVFSTLDLGQINLLLATLVVADFMPRRHRRLPQGVLIGLATGLKLVPGLFIVYLLLTRRLRAVAIASGAFLATVAIGFAVMPAAAWDYWTRLVFETGRIGPMTRVGSQSWRAVLTRVVDDPHVASALWFGLAGITLLAGMAAAVRLHGQGRELTALCAVGLTSLLVSPFSWHHHWIWALLVVLALLLCDGTAGKPAWAAAAVLWCLLFEAAPIWWVPDSMDYAVRYHGWRLVTTNSYALASAAMLAALAVLAFRSTPGDGRQGVATPVNREQPDRPPSTHEGWTPTP